MLQWLHGSNSRWTRIPPGSADPVRRLWVLPVLGIECLPAGLPLPTQDIPFLGNPSDTR